MVLGEAVVSRGVVFEELGEAAVVHEASPHHPVQEMHRIHLVGAKLFQSTPFLCTARNERKSGDKKQREGGGGEGERKIKSENHQKSSKKKKRYQY